MKHTFLATSLSMLAGLLALSSSVCHADADAECSFGTSINSDPWYGTGSLTTNQYLIIPGNDLNNIQAIGVSHQEPGDASITESGTAYATLTNNTTSDINMPGASLCFDATATSTGDGTGTASMTVGSGVAYTQSTGFDPDGQEDDEFGGTSEISLAPSGCLSLSGPISITATN